MPYLKVLNVDTARRVLAATTLAGLGQWTGFAGLAVAMQATTGSATATGSVVLVQAVAGLLASLAAGGLDGVDRSRALAITYLVAALAMAAPLLVAGPTMLVVVAAVLGAAGPLSAALRTAVVGDLLDGAVRDATIAAQRVVADSCIAVGLLAGGAAAGLVSVEVALAGNSVAFLAAAVLAGRVDRSVGDVAARRVPWSGVVECVTDPTLRWFVGVFAIGAAVGSAPEALAASVADGAWLPVTLSVQAITSAVTGAVVGHRAGWQRPVAICGLLAITAVGGGLAMGGHPGWFVAANAVIGVGLAATLLAQTGFVAAATPGRLAGLTGAAIAITLLAEGAGTVALGAVADLAGPQVAYRTLGVTVAVGIAVAVWTRPRRGPSTAGR